MAQTESYSHQPIEVRLKGSDETQNSKESTSGESRKDVENHMLIKEHFSLKNPLSTIAFANEETGVHQETHIFTNDTEQLTIDVSGGSIEAKQTSTATAALSLIRSVYTLVATLMAGFLFAFCIQLILFLFVALVIEINKTAKRDSAFIILGTILSIPTVAVGLAGAMNIAASFVKDTWSGHRFIKSVLSWNSVLTDWITFLVFFLIPVVVGTGCLYAENDRWWEITSLTWFICVFAYYLLFSGFVIFYELRGCYEMVRYNSKNREKYDEKNLGQPAEFFNVIKHAILLRQLKALSGYMKVSYIKTNIDFTDMKDEKIITDDKDISIGILCKVTLMFEKLGLYKKLDQPERVYDVDEVRNRFPLVTNSSWGLEQIYFRDPNDHFIAVIKGNHAITKSQAQSSFVCAILGQLLTLLFIVSLMVWLESSRFFIALVIIIVIIFGWSKFRSSLALSKVHREILSNKSTNSDTDASLFLVKENFRLTEPTEMLCWLHLSIELVLFTVFPIIALSLTGNSELAGVFFLIAIVTATRRYVDAGACFRHIGSLDGIELNNKNRHEHEEWREKHNLSRIVGEISQGRGRNFWVVVFGVFLLIFCSLFIAAVQFGTDDGTTDQLEMLNDFAYEGSTNFPYPTCSMGKGIETSNPVETALVDLTFLSSLAYLNPSATQDSLDKWFGNKTVIDMEDIVQDFRSKYEATNGRIDVSYKLFNFSSKDLQIVAIRGTSNAMDALADAQLWSSAALAQSIRAILPLGELWNPILHHLVRGVARLQSNSLKEVAFYTQTTAFVNLLKKNGANILLTGHSLGGGLATITGSQTKSSALAISGPNSMISRDTFVPKLEEKDINQYTFNVIPDRDPVPRIDDRPQNFQRISCTAGFNDPFSCHFVHRTLCELLYTCGTQMRPALCICHDIYGYPKPTPTGSRTYDEACPVE